MTTLQPADELDAQEIAMDQEDPQLNVGKSPNPISRRLPPT